MSKLIIFEESDLSVEKDLACFVFGVFRNPGQEFCFYISPVPYLVFCAVSCQRMQPCIHVCCFLEVALH